MYSAYIHTRNGKQEERASSDFVNKKRSGDGDNQAEGSVAKGELYTLVSNGQQILGGQRSGGKPQQEPYCTYTKLLRLRCDSSRFVDQICVVGNYSVTTVL